MSDTVVQFGGGTDIREAAAMLIVAVSEGAEKASGSFNGIELHADRHSSIGLIVATYYSRLSAASDDSARKEAIRNAAPALHETLIELRRIAGSHEPDAEKIRTMQPMIDAALAKTEAKS